MNKTMGCEAGMDRCGKLPTIKCHCCASWLCEKHMDPHDGYHVWGTDGDTVYYKPRTDWERKTLLTNGFHTEGEWMTCSKPASDYVARTVAAGGIG